VAEYQRKTQGKKYIFANFEWLSKQTEKYVAEIERTMSREATV